MRRDDELDKELQFHLDERTDELIASGVAPEEARRRARLEFGGVMQTKEAVRDLGIWSIANGFMQDLRFAFRSLRATPIVTFVAVLSLALGIGANTAMFSLVNSLLLRALPVKEPARLVLLKARKTGTGYPEWNYPTWQQIRQRRALFDGVAAYSPTARANLTIPGDTQHVDGLMASGSFFDTLGVSAVIGRTFSDTDDRRDGGPDGPVTVISYRFWQRYFHGSAEAIGKTLAIENVPFTVVGVTPPDFFGPDVGRTFDVIVPLGTEPLISRRESRLDNTEATWLHMIARLRNDQTDETTATALRAQQAQIFDVTRPSWDGDSLVQYLKQTFTLVPAATGESTLRETYRRPLVTILVVVALVLLIACANIANLLLARATARRHELSVRRALGASRWRIARQLLAESALFATLGAGLGLLIAVWGSRLLVSQLSTQARAMVLDLSIDWHVLLFTIAVTAATALLFGVVPAFHASTVVPMDALKQRGQDGRQPGGHGGRVAGGLVVAQIALSLVLVVAAGLFVRTFVALTTRSLGFDREHVLVASVNAHSASIDAVQRLRIYGDVRDAIRELPGVTDAALSAQVPPIDGATMIIGLRQVSGGPLLTGRALGERMAILGFVGPGFFRTFSTPIAAGRDFTARDVNGAPLVAIVNQAFARAYLNGANPIGHTITSSAPVLSLEIIGLSADAVYRSARAPVQPVAYIPLTQAAWAPTSMTAQLYLSLRTSGGPADSIIKSAAAAIRAVNPDLTVTFTSLSDQINASLTQERVVAMLSGFFGALALLLASLGLYGVTAYAVARRRSEIGIRMALGAATSSVVRLVLGRVTMLVAIGVAIGTGASVWASRFVATLLYGLEPRDPLTLVSAAVILGTVGAIAGWLPAYRASRIDPAKVLRDS